MGHPPTNRPISQAPVNGRWKGGQIARSDNDQFLVADGHLLLAHGRLVPQPAQPMKSFFYSLALAVFASTAVPALSAPTPEPQPKAVTHKKKVTHQQLRGNAARKPTPKKIVRKTSTKNRPTPSKTTAHRAKPTPKAVAAAKATAPNPTLPQVIPDLPSSGGPSSAPLVTPVK